MPASGTHPPGVWFSEETEETSVYARRYDLTLTLLHLPNQVAWIPFDEPELPDTFDKFTGSR